ncbi:RNA polymerase [Streptomyces sp. So13.3]|nr:RNA polymerase [Streptomyces sp. So13.3]
MGTRRAAAEYQRDVEFQAFTAGAAGRLLHAATLLTGDPAAAEKLLGTVLAHTYANWFRMRSEDPYDQARTELVRRFAYRPWWRRPHGGALDRLTAQERLVVVLRLFEGVAEEQAAAQLGLPVERVRAICNRATATLRSRPAPAPARSVTEARAAAEKARKQAASENSRENPPGGPPGGSPGGPPGRSAGGSASSSDTPAESSSAADEIQGAAS